MAEASRNRDLDRAEKLGYDEQDTVHKKSVLANRFNVKNQNLGFSRLGKETLSFECISLNLSAKGPQIRKF